MATARFSTVLTRTRLNRTVAALTLALLAWTVTGFAQTVSREDVKNAAANTDAAETALSRARKELQRAEKALTKAERKVVSLQEDAGELAADFAEASDRKKPGISEDIQQTQADLGAATAAVAAARTRLQTAQQGVVAGGSTVAKAEQNEATLRAKLEQLEDQQELAEQKAREAQKQARLEARRQLREERQILADARSADRNVARAENNVDDAREELADARDEAAEAQAELDEAAALYRQRGDELAAATEEKPRKKATKALEKAARKQEDAQQEAREAKADVVEAQRLVAVKEQALTDTRQAAAAAKAAAAPIQASREQPPKPQKPARIREPRPVLEPRKHTREIPVSEPTPWTEERVRELPVLDADQKLTTPPARKGDQAAAAAGTRQFDLPMISGDKEIVEKLDAWQDWAEHVTFNPVTPDEINEFHGKLVKALQEEGYVFAQVAFPTRIWEYGIFLAKVDCGPLGTITVKGNRYYSAEQVIRALARQDGERFNYARIHGDLFDLNVKPDISVDTKLKPMMQDGRRVINAELEVRDDLPIHGAIEASNTGTELTNDWRFRTTLQHVNLTKNDDVLTTDWITSPDVRDVNAFSGGYFLPVGDRYSVSVYGGYSSSDIEDVLPQLDIRGEGYFFGTQLTKTLKNTPKHRLQLSGGYLFQSSKTQQEISGTTWEERNLDMSMPMITLGYSSQQFDKFAGRNFLSNTIMFNFAGSLGSSEKSEFNNEGLAFSDGEFVIDRFQIARLQRFFRGEDEPGKWTLFMKLDGQLASDTLVSAVRKSLGGANTVRGYKEAEISGDQMLLGTVELRTPLFQNFIPGLKEDDQYLEENPEAWQRHRLQFIAFADYGFVEVFEPRPGEQGNESMFSAGVGLRLGLTKYSQMRVDFGYPFVETTEATPNSGRAHLSLQLQF